jgi:hypothetical protein
VRANFWPSVGITALLMALLGFASSVGGASIQRGPAGHDSVEITSAFGLLVLGPLMGGLMLYFLKQIRREKVSIETVFTGFTRRFLHLFLAGFATTLLTWLGFLCFLLPGIYVLVAWMFTLPLVIDKHLDFWSAMELSRQVVTKHWWKFFAFAFVLGILAFAGLLALIVGMFVMIPLVFAALLYAYEDIFGGIRPAAAPAPVATGPSGTVVLPGTLKSSASGPASWTLATKLGLAAVVLVAVVFALNLVAHSVKRQRLMEARAAAEAQIEPTPSDTPTNPIPPPAFGPELERVLTNLTAINLVSGEAEALPESVTDQNRGPDKDSAAGAWMEGAAKDFAYLGQYDGFYAMTRDLIALKRDNWDDYSPEKLEESLHNNDQDAMARFGDSSPLNNPTNFTYGFKTRDGSVGLLQITAITENPAAATIRYKLFQSTTNVEAIPESPVARVARDALNERLEAASAMYYGPEKDKALTPVAIEAAKEGDSVIAKKALQQMFQQMNRDEAAHQAATLLARRGQRKQAIEIAKGITDFATRERTLAELAQ